MPVETFCLSTSSPLKAESIPERAAGLIVESESGNRSNDYEFPMWTGKALQRKTNKRHTELVFRNRFVFCHLSDSRARLRAAGVDSD